MLKRNTFFLLLLSGFLVGTVCGQNIDSLVVGEGKIVKKSVWTDGFRIGLTSQAQVVLPATLIHAPGDSYVQSQTGFGGENGIELSYHSGYFGVSLGLNFGTFRVLNLKPHFENAPDADLDDMDFRFWNQFHYYSMVHNVFFPLKFEFHYPFNPRFAIMADLGVKFAPGYRLETVDGNLWATVYEDIGMKPLYASLVTDVGFYYRLPYGDLLRGAVGANVGFQHVTDGEYHYQNPACNVVGNGTLFSRNTNFNLQVAYIHTFHRYKERHPVEPWQSDLPRHEFQFNVGDPVLAVNSSNIGYANYFYRLFTDISFYNSPTTWTEPVDDYPITRFVPTFSFNYHYRVAKWLWVGGLTTVTGLHNTWRDRFTDEVTGHGSEVHLSWMPDLRFSYLNRKHVTLYSGFGFGLRLVSLKDSQVFDGEHIHYCTPTYQLTAFGVKAGAKNWFGNLELGCGIKGVVSAGFGYEF